MSKVSPFEMEKICSSCGSDSVSKRTDKSEKYCKKCGTVDDNSLTAP